MEKEQQQTAQSAGLIYGLNDRPPLKDSIFAALRIFSFHGSFCIGYLYIYPVPPRRTDRLRTAVYSGNQFFIHWSDYFCGLNRWTECYLRSLYCSFFG